MQLHCSHDENGDNNDYETGNEHFADGSLLVFCLDISQRGVKFLLVNLEVEVSRKSR
jgi:hypothetical protein